jgi:hypothetical protein
VLCFFGCGGDDSGGGGEDFGVLDFAVPQADLTLVTPPNNGKDMAMQICPGTPPSGACTANLTHVSCSYGTSTRCDCDSHLWTCNPASCPVSWMVPAFGDSCTGSDTCSYVNWECSCASGHYACSAGDMSDAD